MVGSSPFLLDYQSNLSNLDIYTTSNMENWGFRICLILILMARTIQTEEFCDIPGIYGCTCTLIANENYLTCERFPQAIMENDNTMMTTSIGVVGEELPVFFPYNDGIWSVLYEVYDNYRKFRCSSGICIASGQTLPSITSTQQLDAITPTPKLDNVYNTMSEPIYYESAQPPPPTPPPTSKNTLSSIFMTTNFPKIENKPSIFMTTNFPKIKNRLSTIFLSTNILDLSAKLSTNPSTTSFQTTPTLSFNPIINKRKCEMSYKIEFFTFLGVSICLIFTIIIIIFKFKRRTGRYEPPIELVEFN
jgi:hypothetical protein